jgi:hypothetical protein
MPLGADAKLGPYNYVIDRRSEAPLTLIQNWGTRAR